MSKRKRKDQPDLGTGQTPRVESKMPERPGLADRYAPRPRKGTRVQREREALRDRNRG